MDAGTITEAQFLLTELQYTLGQLHVQLADLDDEAQNSGMCGDRTIAQVVAELSDSEERYQSQYARLLHLDGDGQAAGDRVALPVADETEQPNAQSKFEHLRTRTLEMLQGTEEQWTQEVVDLVQEQVAHDRTETTRIAECRKSNFEADSRPDLDQPLTTDPTPHAFAEETGSYLDPADESASISPAQ